MKKIILNIFIQIILVLVLLEVFFRVVAFVKVDLLSPSAKKTEGVFIVLCVGDSTTEGLTVSKEFNYPSQLQELLDKYSPKKKFKVINIGHGGMNSSEILNRFNKNIFKYHPDLIVLQAGINDPWNMNESNMGAFDKSTSWNKIKLKADLFFSKFRVYQFAKLLLISYKESKYGPLNNAEILIAKSYELSEDKRERLYKLLAYDISNMVFLAKQHNVPIFLQTYHTYGYGNPGDLINKVYKTLKVPVVDNQAVFDLARTQGLRVLSYDHFHPNKFGYSLIARDVFNMMVKQGMVDSPLLYFREARD